MSAQKTEEKPLDIAELRKSLTRLTVAVVLDGEKDGHPEYKLTVTDTLHMQTYEVKNRFNRFRGLKEKVEKEGKGNEAVRSLSPFPKTLTKSSFGIALTEKELKERTVALNAWLSDIMKSVDKLEPSSVELLATFVNLNHMEERADEAAAAAKKIENAFIKKKQYEAEKKRKEEEEAERKRKELEAAAEEEAKRKNSIFRKQNTPVKSNDEVKVGDVKAEIPKAGCGCVIA